jgi:endonuclease/exonuclease/phosphatase family metal-dependent hydrolase
MQSALHRNDLRPARRFRLDGNRVTRGATGFVAEGLRRSYAEDMSSRRSMRERSDSPPGELVRVATYNIHKGRGLDGRDDIQRILEILRRIDADVIGVQEIYEEQAEHIAHQLRMRLVTGTTVHRPAGPCGNAILTRLPLQGVATFDLSVEAREARGGIRADLDVRGRTVHVLNVHLGLRQRERATQVKWLVERHILGNERLGPRIVVGDLNEWFPGRVGRTLRREFTSLRARRTHPALLPLWALDRIYWDHAFQGRSLRVHRSRMARVASDHLPLVATLRLRPFPPD